MPAAIHDVADIHAFCNVIARQRTHETGQTLNHWQKEDLTSYLTVQAYWLIDPRNPNHYRTDHGQSFSKFAYQRLHPKYVDWNRKEFTDDRYQTRPVFTTLDDADREQIREHVGDGLEEVIATINTALLSPAARATLEFIAKPIVQEGRTINEIADYHNRPPKWVNRNLNELKDEIRKRCLLTT